MTESVTHERSTITKCDDCGRITEDLKQTSACPEDVFGHHGECCTKRVCSDKCMFMCESCLKPSPYTHYDIDGWYSPYTCGFCQKTITPKFTWFGITPEEHLRRYGY